MVMGGHIRRICATAALVVFLTASLGCPAGFAAEPKRVMLLHSFGRDFKPWSEYAKAIRMELDRQSPWPLDITENSLVTARFSDEDPEGPFVDYLRALFAKRPLDLIVSIGAPAADICAATPAATFCKHPDGAHGRRTTTSAVFQILPRTTPPSHVRINFLAAIENILQVLPDTKDVIVVVGTSPIEKFWKEAIAKEVEPLANRIKLSWTNELSFEALLKQASALPPHTAIFWGIMIVDAAGVVHEGDVPLTRLHAVANAPIFSYDEVYFGAIVGGPLLSVADSSRQTAAVAVRILGGEKAGDIKIPPIEFATPKFDWREMQRWGISESRLPAGSEILFRPPTAWEQYRWQILLIAAVLLTQTLLIMGLLYEHQRRRRAEVQSLQRMTELAHLNRVATAGELSASIAHEVKQPLAAVVAQSSAALRWLAHTTPDLNEARAALKKIVFAGNRASEIVDDLRTMFRKESSGRRPLEINTLLANVIELTRHEAQKHGILVQTTFFDGSKLQTLGEQAQLEQVFLNLVMNAIEAMNSSKSDHRILELKTSVNEGHEVLVTVADSGPGVDAENLEKIFDTFFTTKPDGMGMGLSICKTIVEAHGGSLTAVPNEPHGMEFRVVLPIAA